MKLLQKLKKLLLPLKKLRENKTPAPDISELHKEEIGGVKRRIISPWGRRRIRHKRANHPWVSGRRI